MMSHLSKMLYALGSMAPASFLIGLKLISYHEEISGVYFIALFSVLLTIRVFYDFFLFDYLECVTFDISNSKKDNKRYVIPWITLFIYIILPYNNLTSALLYFVLGYMAVYVTKIYWYDINSIFITKSIPYKITINNKEYLLIDTGRKGHSYVQLDEKVLFR